MPRERPTHGPSAPHSPRADRHIGSALAAWSQGAFQRRDQPRNVGRIVAEVGVHVDDDFEALPPSLREALHDRAAEPPPALADEHVQSRLLLRSLKRYPACAVG